MKWLIFFLGALSLSLSNSAFAHNVIGGVYAEGFEIEGEAGFSNGAMANSGTLVKVTDDAGNSLGEALTDEEGAFVFTAKKNITHHFEINMGAGHILKMVLPAEELPKNANDDLMNTNVNKTDAKASNKGSAQQTSKNVQAVNRLMLEKAIGKQLKPLRREIQALKEKSGLRDIIGGIGYIFGLLGLVAFLRERKQKAKS